MQASIRKTTQSLNRYQELDALRGIAAFCVMLFHFTINDNKILLGWQFRVGVTGVDLFFMISGFVILLSASRSNSVREFAFARFVRLYPTFWICVFITFLFKNHYEPEHTGIKELLANATMLPIFFGIEYLDGSYWTLVIELTFYFWIVLLILCSSMKYIAELGLAVLAVNFFFHANSMYYPNLYHFITLKTQIVNHLPLFYSGIIFYYVKQSGWTLKYATCLILSMISSFYLHDKGGYAKDFVSFNEHCLLITSFHILFVLFINGQLRILTNRSLLFLGQISYCLYLIHQYVGLKIIEFLRKFGELNIYPALFIGMVICITSAWLITFYLEIPLRKYLKKGIQLKRI